MYQRSKHLSSSKYLFSSLVLYLLRREKFFRIIFIECKITKCNNKQHYGEYCLRKYIRDLFKIDEH